MRTLEIPIVPRRLVFEPEPPLTDEEFEKLCFANDLFQLERTRVGKMVVNPPATGFTNLLQNKASAIKAAGKERSKPAA